MSKINIAAFEALFSVQVNVFVDRVRVSDPIWVDFERKTCVCNSYIPVEKSEDGNVKPEAVISKDEGPKLPVLRKELKTLTGTIELVLQSS